MIRSSLAVLLLLVSCAAAQVEDCANDIKDEPCVSQPLPSPAPAVTSPDQFVSAFQELDFNGPKQSFVAVPGECVPLGEKGAKSLNTYGSCVELFTSTDCSGTDRRKLRPVNGFYFYDVTIDVSLTLEADKKPIRSIKGCHEEPNSGVSVHDGVQYQGKSKFVSLDDDSCQDLGDMRDKVTSLKHNERCAELFLNADCQGPSIKIFPGTVFPPYDLRGVRFPGSSKSVADNTQAIKRCSVTLDEVRFKPEDSVIKIFSRPNQRGDEVELDLDEGCQELEEFFPVASTSTAGNCVQFFKEKGCQGPSRKVFPGAQFPHERLSIPTMTDGRTDVDEAQSLAGCDQPF